MKDMRLNMSKKAMAIEIASFGIFDLAMMALIMALWQMCRG